MDLMQPPADPAAQALTPDMTGDTIRSVAKDGPPDAATTALVNETIAKVKAWEKHHEKAFDRMKGDVRFATNKFGAQWGGKKDAPDTDSYVANITLNHVQSRTGVLYAKNPRVKAGRRKRLDAVLWDGTPEMLQQAMEIVQMAAQSQTAGLPMDPNTDVTFAQQVLEEAVSIKHRRSMLDRVGRTAAILYEYFQGEGEPHFKASAKAWVRRTVTTGVGWLKLDFQRERGYTPFGESQVSDLTAELNRLESELAKIDEGETFEGSPRIIEIKAQLDKLQADEMVTLREGLVFSFPKSWRVIVDDCCTQLTGLVGCQGMAQIMPMTPDQVREHFKVDVAKSYTKYEGVDKNGNKRDEALVMEVYDKKTGLMSIVCEGYPDFLVPPGPPRVRIERFFPFYPLCFNESECEEGEIYPPSNVELISHMQREYNRSRESLRQHRIASQPGHIINAGAISNEEDFKNLAGRRPHQVIPVKGLPMDKPISNIFQEIPVAKIDQNVYMVEHVFVDVQRTTGDQAANLGGTSGDTATESSIAENSRMSTIESNKDDLDTVLTDVARDGCQVMLMEIDEATAKKIAGPGAVWPKVDRQTIAAEVFLEVVAGSSGRPNRDKDAANIERLMPFALQTGSIKPSYLAGKVVTLMDETVDLEDAILDGLPSIMSMNAAAKNAAGGPGMGGEQPTGDPASDPNQQGDRGGANTPAPAQPQGTARPGYPAPNAAPAAPQTS